MVQIRIAPIHAFLGVVGALFVLRLTLAFLWEGYLGVDGGAYNVGLVELLTGQRFLPAFPRPPLAPGLMLWPFVEFLGLEVGYKLWTVLASLCPLIPVYLLTRKYVGPWPAVFGAGLIALDWFHSEMTVTGGLPLIGFGLIGMAWWLMSELAEAPNKCKSVLLALCIGLIPWVNQTSAGLAVIILPAYWLALFAFQQSWIDRSGVVWHILPFAIIGAVIGALAFPWYTQTLPGSSLLSFGGPMFYLSSWWPTWIQFGFSWALGIFILTRKDTAIKPLAVTIMALGFMLLWLSYDEVLINPPYRSRYLIAVAFYPCVTWLVFKVWWPYWRDRMDWREWAKPLAIGIAAVVGVFWGTVSVYLFWEQAELSSMLPPASVRALEQVPTTETAIGTNSFTMSLWVAGVRKVDAPHIFTAPPPPAYREMDEDMRCLIGWVPGCDVAEAQRALGVTYILIDERFPFQTPQSPPNYMAPEDQWNVTAGTPWLNLIYTEETTRLWKVTHDIAKRCPQRCNQ